MSHPGLLSRSQAWTRLLQLSPAVLGRCRLPWWGEAEDHALPSPGSSQLSVSTGTGVIPAPVTVGICPLALDGENPGCKGPCLQALSSQETFPGQAANLPAF